MNRRQLLAGTAAIAGTKLATGPGVGLPAHASTTHGSSTPTRRCAFSRWLSVGDGDGSYQVEGAWNEDGKGESMAAAARREFETLRRSDLLMIGDQTGEMLTRRSARTCTST